MQRVAGTDEAPAAVLRDVAAELDGNLRPIRELLKQAEKYQALFAAAARWRARTPAPGGRRPARRAAA